MYTTSQEITYTSCHRST